jgi:hypothetical protein
LLRISEESGAIIRSFSFNMDWLTRHINLNLIPLSSIHAERRSAELRFGALAAGVGMEWHRSGHSPKGKGQPCLPVLDRNR